MTKNNLKVIEEGDKNFDWEAYEDGYTKNTVMLQGNKLYSLAKNAKEQYEKYSGTNIPSCKELSRHALVKIDDINAVNGDTMLVSINNGSNNILIDLNKEQRFFNIIKLGDAKLTKETFSEYIKDKDFRKQIIDMGLSAKVGMDIEKASLWDGFVENLAIEMREQITKNQKAYTAKILSINNGGFVVEVADAVKAFMPRSMAAKNKIVDDNELLGKTTEVMVESYDEKNGFVVSRKKYISAITPSVLKEFTKSLEENKDKMFRGKVTGTAPFGIFVEINEILTGMLHKTTISDSLRDALRANTIKPQMEIDVYVHKVENGRIILSDVISSEREAVIAKREAEDANEKGDKKKDKKDTEAPTTTEMPKTSSHGVAKK